MLLFSWIVSQVSVRLLDNNVDCSCKFFARTGFLCRHAFAALHNCEATLIPRQFVLQRWMRNADNIDNGLVPPELKNQCSKVHRIKAKFSEMWFDFQSCMNYVGFDEVKVDDMHGRVRKLKADVQGSEYELREQPLTNDVDRLYDINLRESVVVQNPNISRN